jgi:multiple sugar transport system substrate-binding protein
MGEARTRRDFLRLAAGAATIAATGAACGSGSDKPKGQGVAKERGATGSERTLRIVQWSHFVPAYDSWFDDEYTKRWGEEHGVEVVVDHIPFAEVPPRADAEVAAQRGHDIFGFVEAPSIFEEEVIDHREIVEEVERRLGRMAPLMERSVLNPKTGKYFGFPEYWVANLAHYRTDLWDEVKPGFKPGTWDDVLAAGSKLKAMGFPLGIGFSADGDSNYSLFSLMQAYGATIQDEEGNLTVNRPATVEAVKMGAAIFQAGMTDDVFAWDASSNNRILTSGRGSMILNPVSAIRAAEIQNPDLAKQIQLAPIPMAGPGLDRARAVYITGVYGIWKFSRNQETAKRFLVDLALNYGDAVTRSEFYNLPAFPGAVSELGKLVANDIRAKPPDKYALLAGAERWSTNIGHPGHSNGAIEEVFNQFLVPKMFAATARGEMTAEEAVKAAEAQITPIFQKWRERGKV